MQYYELTIQKNSKDIDIRDYVKYIDEIRDLWDMTIIPCYEYGPKRGKLHVHCLCVREPWLHPLRASNMPHVPGFSVSFSRCKSRFAWEAYYSKHIDDQTEIIEYELLRKVKKEKHIRNIFLRSSIVSVNE